ncbi:MAG: Fe-S cluster assembly protein SufD [Corynebacterium sp.]|nr:MULTISPECIES: Fe-S cluster assembly protein SufD [Corynebacterium]NWO16781.1 Fe-S cluster assembly protein SufD [Corynebacterium sp.]WLP86650.1 Fe-S cluster assembly protein SufD [Corynebacterium stationis]HHT59410.1 Fe-S cluster assembly protein SufD [Corynebacterium stationis]
MLNSNEFSSAVVEGAGYQTKGDLPTSFDVDAFEVPGGRDEEWRFVSLRRLRGLHNGSFAESLKVVPQQTNVTAPEGVKVETVDGTNERLRAAGAPSDRVAAQAWTSMPEATLITIDPETRSDQPIEVTISGAGEGNVSFGATTFDVGRHAEVTLVVKYEGSGTHADNLGFVIGDGAHVTVIIDADWNNDAVHLSNQSIVMGRDSVMRHNSAIFGGEVVRIFPRVRYTAPGGDAELLGVYFADAGQYFENRLLVDHSVPNCRSNVLYKGALQGTKENEARTCWVGDVLIRSSAPGTDTYETNNNLILSDGARADSIPNLEIETGEISGAGHAATVGRFDDLELFYLMSRGIPADEARRLIIRGFFNEVIHRIPVQSLSEELERRVAVELEKINA